MGFMDKAKKMAEQAQAKLDEAQKQFNAGQQGGEQSGPAVEYDEHGRPIAQTPPESSAPPHGDPLAPSSAPPAPPAPTPGVPPAAAEPYSPPAAPEPPPVAQPGVPPTAAEPYSPPAPPAGDAPAPDAPPARPEADAADEDRNNPSYAPPKLSSGDPLAG
jgi:hypothetical protein